MYPTVLSLPLPYVCNEMVVIDNGKLTVTRVSICKFPQYCTHWKEYLLLYLLLLYGTSITITSKVASNTGT